MVRGAGSALPLPVSSLSAEWEKEQLAVRCTASQGLRLFAEPMVSKDYITGCLEVRAVSAQQMSSCGCGHTAYMKQSHVRTTASRCSAEAP